MRLSAALGRSDSGAVEAALARAASVASDAAVEEVVLQSYLFVGYPAALNAFAAWRRLARRSSMRTCTAP